MLSRVDNFSTVWVSSEESHLGLLDSIVRSAEKSSEGELCYLEHRKRFSALCLLCEIYYRVNYSTNKYLKNFVPARNTRALAALGDLTVAIPP